MALVRFSIGVDERIVKEMDAICEKWGLQRGDLIRIIIAEWYGEREKWKPAIGKS